MKIHQILNLLAIYPKIKEQKLPIKTTYKIVKLFDALQKESELYSSQLNTLIERYGLRDDNGNLIPSSDSNGIKLQEDKIELFSEELNELLNLDVSIPDINFSLNELESLEITIEEFNLLLPLINE